MLHHVFVIQLNVQYHMTAVENSNALALNVSSTTPNEGVVNLDVCVQYV